MIDLEQWLNDWIRKRYKHGDHVPKPNYLLTEVFLEALKDYERERRTEAFASGNTQRS